MISNKFAMDVKLLTELKQTKINVQLIYYKYCKGPADKLFAAYLDQNT